MSVEVDHSDPMLNTLDAGATMKGLNEAFQPLSVTNTGMKRKLSPTDTNTTKGPDTSMEVNGGASMDKRVRPSIPDTPAGSIVTFGTGECAQLGLGEDRVERKFPMRVAIPANIISMCAGGIHNVVLTSNNSVYSWGCNDEKALGRTGDEWVPGPVDMPAKIVKVSAGDSHSMALGDDGICYTWGAYRDGSGMMGFSPHTGEPSLTPTPLKFPTGRRVVDIASGVNHSLSLLDNGDIYEWGHIRLGQRVARHHRMDLLKPRLVNVRKFGKVVKIFAGHYQSWAITQQGRVYAFGLNQYCQAGIDAADGREQLHKPEEIEALRDLKVIKMAGGLHHSLALLEDGRVFSFGRNNYGELGHGDLLERRLPTIVANIPKMIDIACGATHSVAVSSDGIAYSCGFGSQLQLGSGDEEDRTSFDLVKGQAMESVLVKSAVAGAQHTLLLVDPKK